MAKTKQRVKIFVSSSCGPCDEIKDAIEAGKFNLEEVEVIDLESEEGYPYIKKLGLSKVPSAYLGRKQCNILINREDGGIFIDCRTKKEKEPATGVS